MDKSDLVYCGLGIYADTLTGKLFEKKASGDLAEIIDEKVAAEQRFVLRHLNDEEVEYDG